MQRLALSPLQSAVGGALIATATLACLSPVHNDTWWHLAYGRQMAASGGFAQADDFSHTASGRPFPNHQWLGERALYLAFRVGGLPAVTALCAMLITTAWILCWRLASGPPLDRLMVFAASVAASTLVWSIRPQVFTVVLLPTVVTLLVGRHLTFVPVIVWLWANLHGGVLLGLIAIAMFTAVMSVSDRPALGRHGVCLAFSGLATVATPLGLQYWPEVLTSLQRSQTNRLQEWQAPAPPPEHLFFWLGACALVALAVSGWRRLAVPGHRGVVATALLLLPAASRSLRNISPFMMLSAPAMTLLIHPDRQRATEEPARSLWYSAIVLVAGLASAAGIGLVWTAPWPRLGWQPIAPEAARAIRQCPAPLYNAYGDGGPIIWFVPEQRVFLDSRQDQYPDGLVAEATAVENGADPWPLLNRYRIRCVALPPTSPTLAAVTSRGWTTVYTDESWVVARR